MTAKASLSPPCRLFICVPQGSVLDPPLFYLYSCALCEIISSHGYLNYLKRTGLTFYPALEFKHDMSRVICVFSVHFTVLISFSSIVHLTRLIETAKHFCRSVRIKVSANCCKCKIGQNVGTSAFFFLLPRKNNL